MDAKDKQGFTPLDVARRKGGQGGIRNPHDATVALLEQLMKVLRRRTSL